MSDTTRLRTRRTPDGNGSARPRASGGLTLAFLATTLVMATMGSLAASAQEASAPAASEELSTPLESSAPPPEGDGPSFAGPAFDGPAGPEAAVEGEAPPPVAGVATLGLNIELSRLNLAGGGSTSTFIPPDTMGSVGPNHIVEMINGNFEIFDKKTGASLETRTLDDFWTTKASLPIINNARFDPRVVYDPVSERWFAVSIDNVIDADNNNVNEQSNNLFVARSDTADPTADWDGFSFDADTVGVEEFHDYPTLGVDADGLYTCTQDFDDGALRPESCYSLPKADLLLAAPTVANLTRFEASPAGLPAVTGSLQPALDFGLSDGRAAVLGSTGTALTRTDIFGGAGAGATLGTPVAITGDPGHVQPPAARQPQDTDAADAETLENVAPRFVGNVFELGNSLWAVHAVRGAGASSALRWYEIDETTNTIIQTGLVDDANRDFHEPTIAANSRGDVVIGYTCSGPTLAASVCVSLGQTTAGVTTFQPPAILVTGGGYYYRDFCTPTAANPCMERNRWGDYSATVIDPVDPCSFWSIQEYVAAGATGDVGPGEAESGFWGTRAVELTFDGCAGDADLRVFKECKPDAVLPAGETGICTILVENLGPGAASAVTAVDRHVSNGTFTFGTVTTTAGTCTVTPNPQVLQGEVNCDLGKLAAGESVVIKVPLSASEPQDINDVVSVASSTADPNNDNNQATDGITVAASADLSIAKSGPATAVAGTQFTYTVGVDNAGPSTAPGVVVTDQLPAGVTFVSAVADVGTFTAAGGTVTWNVGTVAPGDPVREIDITVAVLPQTTGQLVNNAVVTSPASDPNTANNSVTFTTTVDAVAGLTVTKADSPDPVVAGAPVTYSVTVGNTGPSTAQDVVLTDTLPAGVTLISAVDGTGAASCAEIAPGVVSCDIGDLDPGETVTIFITVMVSPSTPSGTVLTNTAQVTSPTDPDGATDTETTTVTTSAELWIEKAGFRPAGNPSGALTYRVTVHNHAGSAPDDTPTSGAGGPSDAQNVVVVDTLPLNSKKMIVQFLSPSCTYDAGPHTVTCTTPTLAAGTAVTYEIQVQVKGSVGTLTNLATVSSGTPDPVAANNTDTVNNVVQGGTGKPPRP